jgi:hypothetical protein
MALASNDLAPDPLDGFDKDSGAGDPGSDATDLPGDGSAIPEPATGLLFLCAAGSMALARLRARKTA